MNLLYWDNHGQKLDPYPVSNTSKSGKARARPCTIIYNIRSWCCLRFHHVVFYRDIGIVVDFTTAIESHVVPKTLC